MTRKPSQTEHTLSLLDQQIRYIAVSEWQTLFDQEKPVAEMFHVAYLAEANEASLRPLTFVFTDQELPQPTCTWELSVRSASISVPTAACPNLQYGGRQCGKLADIYGSGVH